MKNLALILLATCCICETGMAQGGSPRSDVNSNEVTQSGQDHGTASAETGTSRSDSTSSPTRRSTSGRQISPLKPLKTQSGTMPGFMQRAGERLAAQSARTGNSRSNGAFNQQSSQLNQSGLNSIQQENLQQIFLNNALLFDSNSDNQLAYNELRNLFILMISENSVNNNYWRGIDYGSRIGGGVSYGQTPLNNSRPTNSNNQAFNSRSQAPALAILLADSIPTVQGTTLRDATLLFLILTMQFDINGDGALDQSELQRFANALLNNQLNLTQAVQQLQPQRQPTNQRFQ